MKKNYLLITFVFGMFFLSGCVTQEPVVITNFEECEKAGYPIMESYPRQCSDGENTYVEKLNLQRECINNDGRWIEEAGECEYVSEEVCDFLGGVYNECGSACRNDPSAQFCTMQCVPFCSFK